MYIYLGANSVIKDKEIIGIFDIDNTTVSKKTRDFLNHEEKAGSVSYNYAEYDIPKSFILCQKSKEKCKTIFTALTVQTLSKRAAEKNMSEFDK